MLVATAGDELLFREGDATEDFAGIFSAAAWGVTAFLGGYAVIQNRNYQLGIPLQPDERELPQGDKQSALLVAQYQLLVKEFPDSLGDLWR